MDDMRTRKRLGNMLVEEHAISEEQLEAALQEKENEPEKKLGEILVLLGYVTERDVAQVLSKQLSLDVVDLSNLELDDAVLQLVDVAELRKRAVIPIGFAQTGMGELLLAMSDPMDMEAIDDISIITNRRVTPVLATTRDIMLTLDKYFGNSEASKVAREYAKERQQQVGELEQEDVKDDVSNSPIVLLVNTMIEQAARQRASDIHIEALENRVRIRYRIDGTLYEQITYQVELLSAIIARLKIMGGMDIAEKRKPQDGRITLVVDGVEYDIRVSVLPTVYGEKCVMRLAQKKALSRDKKELGLEKEELVIFDKMLQNPNGILLVTGPTGSGKSTTLYTALSELNTEDVNIITVEDPVEANIDGINQVQVNPKAELTFASALRAILRQDPDIIMIGEIRDKETADIAVQASITGHLVVSTLHTNSSAATVTRLLNMGVESYLLADSMIGVIAQRLVRRLCPHCKRAKRPDSNERQLLEIEANDPSVIYEPVGCSKCGHTGYFGRIGIYEMMEVTPEMKTLIASHASTLEMKELAIRQGMVTLSRGARRKVLEGITSLTEMFGVSAEE